LCVIGFFSLRFQRSLLPAFLDREPTTFRIAGKGCLILIAVQQVARGPSAAEEADWVMAVAGPAAAVDLASADSARAKAALVWARAAGVRVSAGPIRQRRGLNRHRGLTLGL